MLKKMPDVAGPWEMHYTEEQRVKVMMARWDARDWTKKVVLVYGPLYLPTSPFYTATDPPKEERRWWVCSFFDRFSFINLRNPEGHGAFFDSITKAQRAADIELKKYNWLLVGSEREPD